MSTCLVLIDVQSGFLTPYTQKVLPEIKRIISEKKEEFDHIIATRFINKADGPFVRIMKWDDMLESEGTDLAPYIESVSEKIFTKELFSCFTAEFEEYLTQQNITKLYMVGIDTDCCVLKSAADCFEKNIDVEVLLRGCASTGGPDSDAAGKLVLERLLGEQNINTAW